MLLIFFTNKITRNTRLTDYFDFFFKVDPNVAAWFNAVDQDRSGSITAPELQRALVNGNWSHFSEEACRMMIGEYYNIKTIIYGDSRRFFLISRFRKLLFRNIIILPD